MPEPHPKEFRDGVVEVARGGDAPIAEVAKDFGISDSCLRDWLHAADVEEGHRPGVKAAECVELRDLHRRDRLLEQAVEVLRRATAHLSRAHLPGKGSACLRVSRMESFFSLSQMNVPDWRRWATRQQLRPAVITGSERTCHRRRRRPGGPTPIEDETINTTQVAAAA